MWNRRFTLLVGLAVAVALLFSNGQVVAQGESPTGPAGQGDSEAPLGVQAELYNQLDNPSTAGIASQNTPDVPSFSNQAADDFVFVVPTGFHGWLVDTVEVMGSYPGTSITNVVSVNVQFYADSGAGLPGTLVYGATVGPASIGNMTTGSFILTLSPPAALAPGTNWVSVQPNKNFLTTGQWFWTQRLTQNYSPSAWQNPSGALVPACRNWGARVATCAWGTDPDLIFRLNGTIIATVAKVYLPVISR